MTGTALTEATEFGEIYRLEVVEIPTNVAVGRQDADDEIYRTLSDKTRAIVKLVEDCRERQQPMLVGTVSIEKSEALAEELKKRKIPHNVLNARYHEQEAQIIAQAGRPGGSPSRPTWPAAAPIFSSAAMSRCWCARASPRSPPNSPTRPSATPS